MIVTLDPRLKINLKTHLSKNLNLEFERVHTEIVRVSFQV